MLLERNLTGVDLSETYEIMCEKAGEDLSRYWDRRYGDVCAGTNGSRLVVTNGRTFVDNKEPYRFEITNVTCVFNEDCWQGHPQKISSLSLEHFTWLPRVDQLLCLIWKRNEAPTSIILNAPQAKEAIHTHDEMFVPETPEQQLLLQFMEIQYKKKWDSIKEEWVY
ncbi:hypothetical protein ACFYKX_10790 [Cytobacillus sp. FJAT-54145]|uniref:Uncharacterized protein n=1 Tax=Cytobacillus spartinae TaxID=3299023 RepID=A0ABW6KA99_9BACI